MIRPVADVTTKTLQAALEGLDARQRAIASNVANIETPNYRATRVNFEDSLRAALANGGDPASASVSTERSAAPTRLNGNNVNMDVELVEQTETLLRTQLVVQALNHKYSMLRTAIVGQ